MKILIVYGTRHGWTKKTSVLMEQELSGRFHHQVNLSSCKIPRNLKNQIKNFDLVIAGSSIQSSFWKSGVKRFLKKYQAHFRKLALFVCAGGSIQAARNGKKTLEEAVNYAIEKYIIPVKEKYGLDTLQDGVFGGQKGKDPKIKYNSWKKEEVISWTEKLNALLMEGKKN